MPLYTPSSTTLGSTISSFTSSGEDLNSRLMMKELIHTDLPEPVEPAMSRWGILDRSAMAMAPPISRPSATVRRLEASANSREAMTSRMGTVLTTLLGTSMPTAAFPGMGASMRTPQPPD